MIIISFLSFEYVVCKPILDIASFVAHRQRCNTLPCSTRGERIVTRKDCNVISQVYIATTKKGILGLDKNIFLGAGAVPAPTSRS
jgi:hypothetical protein